MVSLTGQDRDPAGVRNSGYQRQGGTIAGWCRAARSGGPPIVWAWHIIGECHAPFQRLFHLLRSCFRRSWI